MKEFVCFVFVDRIHRTGRLEMRRGAWAWFHDSWTCGAKVLEY